MFAEELICTFGACTAPVGRCRAESPEVVLLPVVAVSAGAAGGEWPPGLAREEDSRVEVDVNVVMDAEERYIGVQGAPEHRSFYRIALDRLLDITAAGIVKLLQTQRLAAAQA